MKLDIGSGGIPKELPGGQPAREAGWVTVDGFTTADVQAMMWALPFPNNSVELIWCTHALEHIPKALVIPTLTEWFRVLEPGGRCVLVVPDLVYVVKRWLERSAIGQGRLSLDLIFGNQTHDGEFHKTGWDEHMLREDTESVGFHATIERHFTPEYSCESLFALLDKPSRSDSC